MVLPVPKRVRWPVLLKVLSDDSACENSVPNGFNVNTVSMHMQRASRDRSSIDWAITFPGDTIGWPSVENSSSD